MSQDQFPAVIDATNAQIVPAQRMMSASEFNREIGIIEAEIPLVEERVKRHTAGLVYAIVECGFLLLRAREIHRVATVASRSDGTFQTQDSGFLKWITKRDFGFSERTVYNYITSAENAGLTADSDPADVKRLRDHDALADKTPEDLRRKPKRHEPAAEIVQETEPTGGDFMQSWMEHEHLLQEFYKGWTAATEYHFEEKATWIGLTRQDKEGLRELARAVYYKIRDSLIREDEKKRPAMQEFGKKKKAKAEPDSDKPKEAPPDLKRFHFEFEKPRGGRKLKGNRWFYGYQTPEGKIELIVYRGKTTEAAAESFKQEHPDLTLIGPFYTTSLRYAKEKVKQALSGCAPGEPIAEEIGSQVISVPK